MADGLNKVTLIGNIGQDPELRFTQSGTAVMSLRVATSESFLKDDKRQEHTEWHTIVIWGKRAEGLNKILSKGDRIGVDGKLRTRTWEAQDGVKRYSTEIIANQVILCGAPKKSSSEAKPSQPAKPSNTESYDTPAIDDDFPF